MALFNFGKKKQQAQNAPGSPLEQAMVLKQRGMDNNSIIQELERQGYDSTQIFDALNQLNISGAAASPEAPPGYGMPPPAPSFEQPFTEQPPAPEPQRADIGKEQIEEVAEAIIDEKWKEFEEDVRKIIDWKDKTEIRVGKIDQQIKDLTTSLNSLHKNIINKISDYDKSITDVGTEIKAMEKVFQKVLPNLTENVNKLERMAKGSRSTRK
jgi:hypothetical protein